MTEIMSAETIDKMMEELGVDDQDFVAKEIETESAGTALENLIQSGKSLVLNIWQKCLDQIWLLVQGSFRLLIPMLYLRYATGVWLEEFAKDRGLSRYTGQFTILTLTATKDDGIGVTLHAGDVFYINEQEPRRYQVLADLEVDQIGTTFQFQVQALAPTETEGDITYIFSKDFNAPTGLVWDSEDPLPINSVTFSESEYDQVGEDKESDDGLRSRIYSLISLESIELGVNLYYEQLLKTVGGVAHVTLDSVDDSDATLNYTLYGESGQLSQSIVDDALVVFNAAKMRTDKGVLSSAAAQNIDITVSRSGGGSDAEIINAVGDYFLELTRGENFESCFLYDELHDTWPEMVFRLNPTNLDLPTGKFFVPNTTVEAL